MNILNNKMNSGRSRRLVAAALASMSTTSNDKSHSPLYASNNDMTIQKAQVTNMYAQPQTITAQPQPTSSTSTTQFEPISDTSHLRDDTFEGDFSDDDSVADPPYIPDPYNDESTISDLYDFCEEVLNNNGNCVQVTDRDHSIDLDHNNAQLLILHSADNRENDDFIHQHTQQLSSHNDNMLENLPQTFIAQYPGPIFVTNNVNETIKNKNMLKHPMIHESCNDKCRKECSLKFSLQERLDIWKHYWNSNFQARRGFLNKFVEFFVVKRRKVEASTSFLRNETRHYYLPKEGTVDKIQVCKRFFLNTLGCRTDSILTEFSKSMKLYASMSGEKRGGKRKVINRNILHEHILSYKPTVSHYRRHNSPFTRYLPRELTVRTMHSDYIKKYPQMPCSEETYRNEIKHLKISFLMPRGDKCDECFMYAKEKKKYTDESLIPESLKQKYKIHKTKSDQALENYKNDATLKNSKFVKYFSMDLQKVILLPLMPQIKEAVFISRLITFNLTFAPINKKSADPASCVLWHEGQAGRQASNIVDAIFTFMKSERDCRHFHIWADNCTAQNKNWTLFAALVSIVNSSEVHIESITLSYLTKGHTHMTADSVHGNIERKIKRQGDVLDFEDFKNIVNNSRQNIRVIELIDSREWPKKKRAPRKNDDEDLLKTFIINEVVQAKFVAGSRNMFYKTCFEDSYAELDFLPKKYKPSELPKKVSSLRGIPAQKKATIISKLVPLMPQTRRQFWFDMSVNDDSLDLQIEGEMEEETN